MKDTRRNFLSFLGYGAKTLALLSFFPLTSSCSKKKAKIQIKTKNFNIPSIPSSNKDELLLAKGLHYDILIKAFDPLNSKNLKFGYNNDFNAFIPISNKEGYLMVNHEYPSLLFVGGYIKGKKRTKEQILKEKKSVGMSLLYLKKNLKNKWEFVFDHKKNQRWDATSKIPFSNKVKISNKNFAIGTLANCSGGITPWNTFLSCEENFYKFYGNKKYNENKITKKSSYEWVGIGKQEPPEHYGWVVEINPRNHKITKHISMGRYVREGALVSLAPDKRPVIYSGEDRVGGAIYKFISHSKHSLKSGDLYVADTKKGKWLALDIKKSTKLQKHFKNQVEVLIYASEAAEIVGATPQDRPEGIAENPKNKNIIISSSNNISKKNFFGALLKLEEENQNPLSMSFRFSTLIAGGKNFACPDNLVFDSEGNLWFASDISEKKINKSPYTKFKNNGLFVIPVKGKQVGEVIQVASAPIDSELTGPFFAPDEKSLFLSVQHPGSRSKSLNSLTSNWPDGNGKIPKPAVVQIYGSTLEKITNPKTHTLHL